MSHWLTRGPHAVNKAQHVGPHAHAPSPHATPHVPLSLFPTQFLSPSIFLFLSLFPSPFFLTSSSLRPPPSSSSAAAFFFFHHEPAAAFFFFFHHEPAAASFFLDFSLSLHLSPSIFLLFLPSSSLRPPSPLAGRRPLTFFFFPFSLLSPPPPSNNGRPPPATGDDITAAVRHQHHRRKRPSSASPTPKASDALPLPLYLTNAIFFTLFFSIAYYLLHRWRDKIRSSTLLHVVTLSEITTIVSLIASFIYLLGFFGIDFVQSFISRASHDVWEDDDDLNHRTVTVVPSAADKPVPKLLLQVETSEEDEEVVSSVVEGDTPS